MSKDATAEAAWLVIKPDFSPEKWSVAEDCAFRSFFGWGWDAYKINATSQATIRYKKLDDSNFENWYGQLQQTHKGLRQIAREAYEAGMNDKSEENLNGA
jgi:hypothetical protein